ncbi:hypothetical protein HanXRQr2_Chr13g0570661 [Helianthus annuus]|uniref:Uncharacterized protein n=1 Tax=Helianthus annuus TaxID=4232 RepID=A0A9K3EF90_HELAN|nr:hypothetical protein HanXRQr2_Chr13g0570661 [Helianthus annuus]KAJ0847796.1 hypothetical protein HanPSC8_Chr13g0549471 [Helianthus annuus]
MLSKHTKQNMKCNEIMYYNVLMSIADIRCENMESMKVTDRHMCFTPKQFGKQ